METMTQGKLERITNEEALTMVEHAIDYLGTRGYPDDGIMLAIGTLFEARKAIGPMGHPLKMNQDLRSWNIFHKEDDVDSRVQTF
jgi:hypothetical protein